MHDSEFEIDFNHDDLYLIVQGTACWDIDNDSFDYAGTHCTHGQAGTCNLPDYARLESVSVDFAEIERTIDGKEVVEKISWEDKDKMKAFEKEWGTLISELLQEREDDNGEVIESINQYAEELKHGI